MPLKRTPQVPCRKLSLTLWDTKQMNSSQQDGDSQVQDLSRKTLIPVRWGVVLRKHQLQWGNILVLAVTVLRSARVAVYLHLSDSFRCRVEVP